MTDKTLRKKVLFPRRLTMYRGFLRVLVFAVFMLTVTTAVSLLTAVSPKHAAAATASTLNFQARLQSNTGALVPDGNYNVQFNLYNVSSGGSTLWTETYLVSNTQGVRVKNGYLTVNLGSLTSFPSTINWDQDLWIGLTVRGTASCTFATTCTPADSEMTPRLKLTAVPYAFKAGQLVTGNGTLQSTLSLVQPTVGNQVFQIPDMAAAGTYTLLTTTTANANYIQNQTASPQTAGFNISGNGLIGGTLTVGSGAAPGSIKLQVTGPDQASSSTAAIDTLNVAGGTGGGGTGGSTAAGNGSAISLTTGIGGTNPLGSGAGGNGGVLTLAGGTGGANSAGGGNGGVGGVLNFNGGTGGANTSGGGNGGSGGSVNLTGGTGGGKTSGSGSGGTGGNIVLTGGTGGTTAGSGTGGNGGSVTITGGSPGTGSGGNGTRGAVNIQTTSGNIVMGNATGTFALTTSNIGISSAGVISGATGLTVAGTVNLNASNNATTNIGTGTTTNGVNIGGDANNVTIGTSGSATGTTNVNTRFVVGGTTPTTLTSTNRAQITGTFSTNNATQYGLQNNINFNPQTTAPTDIYGTTSTPVVSGSALNITTLTGFQARVSSTTGYTGKITNAVGIEIQGPSLLNGGGATNQYVDDYRGLFVGGGNINGGNTTGTVNNYQLRFNGITSGAGVGGTLNNYGVYVTQPSGSGGTTNNYGIYITGAGAGTTNYALYNSGSAPIYSQGNIQINTTSNPSNYALQVAGDINTTTGVVRTNGTTRLDNSGALSNITGYSQSSGNFSQSGTGTFSTGTGAVSINGDTAIASGKILNAGGDVNIGAAINRGGSGRYFSDGFESGTYDNWGYGPTANGSSTVGIDTATVHNGLYSAKIVANNAAAFTDTYLTGNSMTLAMKGYVYIASQTSADADMLFAYSDNNLFGLYRNNSTGKLAVWNSVTNTGTDTSATFTTGSWHSVEMVITVNATTGSITVYYDGTSVLTQTNTNTGSESLWDFKVGTGETNQVYTMYADDVVVDTVRPGASASLNVNDSLHVAGTSSFGGNVVLQQGAWLQSDATVDGKLTAGGRLAIGSGGTWMYQTITVGSEGLSPTTDGFFFAPMHVSDDSDLRLYIADDGTDAFSIWGDMCGGGDCASPDAATQVARFQADGNITLGKASTTVDMQGDASVAGDLYVAGNAGVMLNGADNPMITRGFDTFTSGAYNGIGRWGMFMEANTLTLGAPNITSNGNFQIARYNADSTIASTPLYINDKGASLFKNGTNSTTGFQVQSSGSSTSILNVDTSNSRVGINTNAPSTALDVNGEIKGTSFSGSGLTDCDASGSKLLWDATTKQFICGTDRASVSLRKSADETLTSSTTMQPDNDYTFTVGPNETWSFEIFGAFKSGVTPGMKWGLTAPTGATCVLDLNDLYDTMNDSVTTCGGNQSLPVSDTVRHEFLHYGTVVTGANGGSVTLTWAQNTSSATTTTVFTGGHLNAYKISGADLAEAYYTHDLSIQPGDIVSVDGSLNAGVKKSGGQYDGKVLGVVSTKPGMVLGDDQRPNDGAKPVLLALNGRVPVKVSDENGPVKPGDYLTASSTPGVAMKATEPGMAIGTALTGFDGPGAGTVMVFMRTGYVDPRTALTVAQDPDDVSSTVASLKAEQTDLQSQVSSLQGQNISLQAVLNGLGSELNTKLVTTGTLLVTGDATVRGNLTVLGSVSVGELTVGGHIKSQGDPPKIELQPAAGSAADDQAAKLPKAAAEVQGNDTAGTIAITIGQGAKADDLLKLTFLKAFESVPQVVLTPVGKESALLSAYVDQPATDSFMLGIAAQPSPGATYKFTYHVLQ